MYEFLSNYRGSDKALILKGEKKELPDAVGMRLLELGIVKRVKKEPEKRRRHIPNKAMETPPEDKMMRKDMIK